MYTHRLRTYDVTIPGGYCFEQDGKTFICQPLIEAQARAVAVWRAANGKPRATVQEALVDVDHYNALRLGNNPTYCVPINLTAPNTLSLNNSSPIIAPPCHGCGAPVK